MRSPWLPTPSSSAVVNMNSSCECSFEGGSRSLSGGTSRTGTIARTELGSHIGCKTFSLAVARQVGIGTGLPRTEFSFLLRQLDFPQEAFTFLNKYSSIHGNVPQLV